MSSTRDASTQPKRYKASGTAPASVPFRKLEKRLGLAFVLIPLVGAVAAIVMAVTYGLRPVEIVLFLLMYTAAGLGLEVGYHRFFSHRSFETNGVIKSLLAILGSMNGQGPVLFWVAIHRRHHASNDNIGDPHSPHIKSDGTAIRGRLRGLWHAHVGWLFEHEITDWGRYIPDLVRDSTIYRLNRLYFVWMGAGIVLPAIAGGLLTWSWIGCLNGFLLSGLARIFLAQQISWGVNSICHLYGRRPFETQDRSANNGWFALFSFGGCWHNNHHAFPRAAITGLRWWQIDPSGWLIRLWEKMGLAWNISVIPPRILESRNQESGVIASRSINQPANRAHNQVRLGSIPNRTPQNGSYENHHQARG